MFINNLQMKNTPKPDSLSIKLPFINISQTRASPKMHISIKQQNILSSSMEMQKTLLKLSHSRKREKYISESSIQTELQRILLTEKSEKNQRVNRQNCQYRPRKRCGSMNMNANFISMCQKQMREYERVRQNNFKKQYQINKHKKSKIYIKPIQNKKKRTQLSEKSVKNCQNFIYVNDNQENQFLNKKRYSQLSLEDFVGYEIIKLCGNNRSSKIIEHCNFYNDSGRKRTYSELGIENPENLKGWTSSHDIEYANLYCQ